MTQVVDCWAVVPAAGVGRRMGAAIPKQYLKVAGCTILEHSVRALRGVPGLRGIIVACAPADDRCQALAGLRDERVSFTCGGERRCDSVLAALDTLAPLADPSDWVLVHDAVRPCVDARDLQRLVEAASVCKGGGLLLAAPVVDTLKRVAGAGNVVETVDRDRLWRAQTPQMFRLGELREALQAAITAGVEITDEASAMEWRGHPVAVVRGSSFNIKVTGPEDLELVRLLLTHGRPETATDGDNAC